MFIHKKKIELLIVYFDVYWWLITVYQNILFYFIVVFVVSRNRASIYFFTFRVRVRINIQIVRFGFGFDDFRKSSIRIGFRSQKSRFLTTILCINYNENRPRLNASIRACTYFTPPPRPICPFFVEDRFWTNDPNTRVRTRTHTSMCVQSVWREFMTQTTSILGLKIVCCTLFVIHPVYVHCVHLYINLTRYCTLSSVGVRIFVLTIRWWWTARQ